MGKKRRRKTGRPKLPTDQRREIRFEIRFSPNELERVKKVAKGNVSTWIRDTVMAVVDQLIDVT